MKLYFDKIAYIFFPLLLLLLPGEVGKNRKNSSKKLCFVVVATATPAPKKSQLGIKVYYLHFIIIFEVNTTGISNSTFPPTATTSRGVHVHRHHNHNEYECCCCCR